MLVDLVIDGNYVLNRLVFILNKNNLLFGALHRSLERSIESYSKRYPFANIYLVSDSKEASWRKKLTKSYKSTRKKSSDIDWKFVYTAYGEVKEELGKRINVLEAPNVEGDDWISYIVEKSNKENRSVMIVSNDYDLKQLLKFDLSNNYLNFMTNEMSNKEKIFLPVNYKLILNKVKNLPNDNIFELNDNSEFLNFLEKTLTKCDIHEVNDKEELFLKLVSGDSSDNILSAWVEYKNGKKRGIGAKGAKKIYEYYLTEFGELDLKDPDFFENTADLICEVKKVPKLKLIDIVNNIKHNSKLIDLNVDNLPDDIVDKMNDKVLNI